MVVVRNPIALMTGEYHANCQSKTADAGWSLNEMTLSAIPPSSPIAAASSYDNFTNGFEDWIEILSVYSKGIEVMTWSGAINGWQELAARPPVLANVTEINGSKNITEKIFGDLAVTATGAAFAVVTTLDDGMSADSIENWQVDDDAVTWAFVGNVSLDGAWNR